VQQPAHSFIGGNNDRFLMFFPSDSVSPSIALVVEITRRISSGHATTGITRAQFPSHELTISGYRPPHFISG
jgi:hypothetical protein